ncbi:MAG TPA: SipW-dependent-type signal peptide-containing protein [Bdellovibrionales bacterium]|nr:SipW-dependent-type signal peptide-containing protein [Bdellovibrionales bacterium]
MKLRKLLFAILFLALIGGGAFAAWSEIEAKNATIEELEQKNAELTQEAAKLKQNASALEESSKQAAAELEQIQQTNCKGIWTPGKGCEEPQQIFNAPVGGETLCFGKTIDVKWDSGPITEESVDIMLATSSNSGKLATVQNLAGLYQWELKPTHKTVGDDGSFTIAEGLYKLRLQNQDGALLGKDTELFSIKNCSTKKAKASKKTATKPAAKSKAAAKAPTRKKK